MASTQPPPTSRFKRFGIPQDGTKFFFDLGTRFPANRIAFFPRLAGVSSEGRPFSEDYIRGYVLKINDGASFNERDEPIYAPIKRVDFTRENTAQIDFPLQFVRYIELEVTSASPFELAEFQLFGTWGLRRPAPIGQRSSTSGSQPISAA